MQNIKNYIKKISEVGDAITCYYSGVTLVLKETPQ